VKGSGAIRGLVASVFFTLAFAAFGDGISAPKEVRRSSPTNAHEVAIAQQALRDGLWEVARAHAGLVSSDEARLIVLESWAGEDRWDEVGRLLGQWKDAKGDGFDYYRAAVKDDLATAMAIMKRGGSVEGLLHARLYEAKQLSKSGRKDLADGIWREVAADTNAGERVRAVACSNLMDVELLRTVYGNLKSAPLRRMVGCRFGIALLSDEKTFAEGERLVRGIVRESPDAEGAREAFLALADAQIGRGAWKEASETYHKAIETWPDLAKSGVVQEGRGWAFSKLKMWDEALEAYALAGELAKDDEARAVACLREGDVLQELGKTPEATAKYKFVIDKYPTTQAAKGLKDVVRIRELEASGREHYRNFRFDEAMKAFEAVAASDAARRDRMEFFVALCLYGQGRGEEAARRVQDLVRNAKDEKSRPEILRWLAKYLFNKREWKESGRLFVEAAELSKDSSAAAEDLLWAARAAFADGDFARTIQLTSRLAERAPVAGGIRDKALLVQGEALVELARFDEAVLVLDRIVASDTAASSDLFRARMLKADALYSMGADNPARYETALDAYRAIRFGGDLTPSERLVLSFKIARTLQKLRRTNEAIDEYYAEVVLAYRKDRLAHVRFSDEARAAFSRAAFWLADEHENRGRDAQAVSILKLVAESDVPASTEAVRRIERIENKGRML